MSHTTINKKNKILKLFFILLIINTYFININYSLTLEQYLKEVAANNDQYTSSELLAQAGFARSEEGDLILSPNLTSSVNYTKDAQPGISEVVKNATRINKDIRVGVAKKFTTGTNLKLDYNNYYYKNNIPNSNNPATQIYRQNTENWTVKPTFTLEQPLIRDWLGRETNALIQLKNAQALALGHQNNFNKKQILAHAQSAYWDLATIVESIALKKDAVQRSSKLVAWAERRSKLGLANDSDYLQAKSSKEQRQFELESLIDQQKAAARLLNAYRTIQSDEVPDAFESFKKINLDLLKKYTQLPQVIREDLEAQYQVYLSKKAEAEISKQSISTDLKLNMQYYPSGRDVAYNKTAEEALDRKNNSYSLGANFSIPLDRALISKLNSSYQAQSRAALLEYNRKKFELTNEWLRLTEQFKLYTRQLDIALSMIKTQESKLKNEEELLKNGRTTTFQVLQFEDDYFNSQLQYLNTKNKLLQLTALMGLFKNI